MTQTPRSDAQPRLKLTQARTEHKWSQQDVADLIGTTGLNVSRWERGITRPGPYFRAKLCKLFGKDPHELDLGPAPAPSEPATPPSTPNEPLYDGAIPLRPPTRLVGRENELAQLKQRLFAGGIAALTALNGLPGVGKTALSIELAYDLDIRAHFRDGILWAALGPEPSIPTILTRWGTLLGISSTEISGLSDNDAKAAALGRAIGARSMLLVIDDAWHLEDALALTAGGPNCAHLVTTRFPGIATEIAGEGATVVRELNEHEGMTLLRMLAPRVVDHEEQKALDLVNAVGGLPLALTLMGKYLHTLAYTGQPRRIAAALERLSRAEERLQLRESRGPRDRHSSLPRERYLSLQSVFAVTDQQLDEQARDALYALPVFPPKPSSFSEEAALVVAGCTVNTLDALLDTGLLESSAPGRYTLHQTIADYARLRLQDSTPYERLVSYFTGYVEAHKKDYELLEMESNIILVALERAYELGRWPELVRCACAFAPFLLVRGIYATAEQHLQRAYDAAMVLGDSYGITTSLLYLGELAQKQGNYAQAEAFFQEGLALARRMEDRERISALLHDIGWVISKRGEYARAEEYLQEGLTLARQIADSERISGLLKTLGSVAVDRGDYTQAVTYLEEGLTCARQIGDQEQTCVLLINLGATVGEQGNHIQAETYFREGLALARQLRHRELISLLLINLGGAAIEQEHYSQAETYLEEGLVLARQIEHREWISALLSNLGLAAQMQGRYTQAETYLQESLAMARQIGRPQIISNALYAYGNLYLHWQQIESAQTTFREMLTTVSEGSQDLIALAQYGLARAAMAQGNIEEAWKFGKVSVTTLEVMGHRTAQEVRDWLNSIHDGVEGEE
jgi:tetratricopeptide (TPR) repeat protein/transcriptional regulator with XRE-family HTH domain